MRKAIDTSTPRAFPINLSSIAIIVDISVTGLAIDAKRFVLRKLSTSNKKMSGFQRR